MAYTTQDKFDFAIKDAKYSIGQGMGNAFAKAIDFYLSDKNINKGNTENDALLIIEGLRDMFFKSNQEAIQQAFDVWLKTNEKRIKLEVGLEVPTIENGIEI